MYLKIDKENNSNLINKKQSQKSNQFYSHRGSYNNLTTSLPLSLSSSIQKIIHKNQSKVKVKQIPLNTKFNKNKIKHIQYTSSYISLNQIKNQRNKNFKQKQKQIQKQSKINQNKQNMYSSLKKDQKHRVKDQTNKLGIKNILKPKITKNTANIKINITQKLLKQTDHLLEIKKHNNNQSTYETARSKNQNKLNSLHIVDKQNNSTLITLSEREQKLDGNSSRVREKLSNRNKDLYCSNVFTYKVNKDSFYNKEKNIKKKLLLTNNSNNNNYVKTFSNQLQKSQPITLQALKQNNFNKKQCSSSLIVNNTINVKQKSTFSIKDLLNELNIKQKINQSKYNNKITDETNHLKQTNNTIQPQIQLSSQDSPRQEDQQSMLNPSQVNIEQLLSQYEQKITELYEQLISQKQRRYKLEQMIQDYILKREKFESEYQ